MNETGILIVNKAQDMTSHDCVNIVRRATKIKRVGHTGTLDPMATGVLPICIGKATKIADHISLGDKRYEAEFRLGVRTDTYDITGKILEEHPVDVTEEELTAAIKSFEGEGTQLPPMYSAKKVNGKKLYHLARKGIEVEREPIDIHIYEIHILEIGPRKAKIDVKCSKGTYIRTLIDDIGKKLGCGACMTKLTRTECGIFKLSDPRVVDVMSLKKPDHRCLEKLIPADKLFAHFDMLTFAYEYETKLKNGFYLPLNALGLQDHNVSEGRLFRGYTTTGEFLGLVQVICNERNEKRLKIYKSFY